MRHTRGIEVSLMCMPLREWGNWKMTRQTELTMACLGPLRFSVRKLTITR